MNEPDDVAPPSTETVLVRAMTTVVALDLTGSGAAELAAMVRTIWSRCLDDETRAPDVRLDVRHEAGADATALLDGLAPRITIAAIGHQAGRLMMLHACGLATTDGRVLALVAPSGTGKTTAARLLGDRLGYVTDETVAVDEAGRVTAYPKPLSVREDGLHKTQLPVDDLMSPVEELRLHRMLLLRRDVEPGGEAWLEPLDLLPALAALATETSYLAEIERPLHRLADLVRGSGGLRVLHYADSAQLVPLVDAVLGEA